MRRNAMLADAQHRVSAIEALERITSGAWLSPVAGRVNISEIRTARPLQDVAGNRRHVPQLCGGARKNRFGEYGIAVTHDWVPCQLTVGDVRPDDDRI